MSLSRAATPRVIRCDERSENGSHRLEFVHSDGEARMTDRRSGQPREGTPVAFTRATDVSEEIEVRGHIVDSLLLPKILDRILLMGGYFEIRECKIGVHRADPSYADRDSGRKPGNTRRHPRRPGRTWRLADSSRKRHDRHRRYRRRVSRRVLQHDQPADPGSPGRAWVEVLDQEMDCGIVVEGARQSRGAFR